MSSDALCIIFFFILVYGVVSSSTYTMLFLCLYRKTAFEQNIFFRTHCGGLLFSLPPM